MLDFFTLYGSLLARLRLRPAFREAFAGFDIDAVAAFGPEDAQRLMTEPSIRVPHRNLPDEPLELRDGMLSMMDHHQSQCVEKAVANAKVAVELRREFGSLAAYTWSFAKRMRRKPTQLSYRMITIVSDTNAPELLYNDLCKRGWSGACAFTLFAFLQEIGFLNGHEKGCAVRDRAEAARKAFTVPA